MHHVKIIGVHVFLEKRKTRLYVGSLKKANHKFVFIYDDSYFKAKNIIPLGPEFPLTKKKFTSKELFPSLEDRIPSQQNPAYPEYCDLMGIDPQEQDPFILLSTIGHRGPSSFVFSPIFERQVSSKDIKKFRRFLRLSTREFAAVFELSQTSLTTLERNSSSGKDVLKRLEILLHFPKVAIHLLLINGGRLMYDKWLYALHQLRNLENSGM